MNQIQLHNISFPVYYIGNKKPLEENKIHYFLYGKNLQFSDAEYKVKIIDDKNEPGDTLAKRRMSLISRNIKLYPLRKAIFFLQDLIKLAKSNVWFIDSLGTVFEYKKSIKVPLVFKKIKTVINIPTGGAIIEVEGISTRFKVLYIPEIDKQYAGILMYKSGYILYGLYDKKYDNTTRTI